MNALLLSFQGIFLVTATIVHIWTVIVAFTESGLFAALISFFLPVLSEIYWMFAMWGENSAYAVLALIHLIITIPMSFISR